MVAYQKDAGFEKALKAFLTEARRADLPTATYFKNELTLELEKILRKKIPNNEALEKFCRTVRPNLLIFSMSEPEIGGRILSSSAYREISFIGGFGVNSIKKLVIAAEEYKEKFNGDEDKMLLKALEEDKIAEALKGRKNGSLYRRLVWRIQRDMNQRKGFWFRFAREGIKEGIITENGWFSKNIEGVQRLMKSVQDGF